MYRSYQEKLYRVLIGFTFFRSQAAALAIGCSTSRKNWQELCDRANQFLQEFLTNRVIRLVDRRVVPPSTLRRYGVEAHPLYFLKYQLFRNVLAVFDSDQE